MRVGNLIDYSKNEDEIARLEAIKSKIEKVLGSMPKDKRLYFLKLKINNVFDRYINSGSSEKKCIFDINEIQKVINDYEIEYNKSLKYRYSPVMPKEKIDEAKKILEEFFSLEKKEINSNTMVPEVSKQILKKAFQEYEEINRQMIISRLDDNPPKVINEANDDKLLLVHFIPNFQMESDDEMEKYLESELQEHIISKVEESTGRKFDLEKDKELYDEMHEITRNPFCFENRVPVRGKYLRSTEDMIVTKKTTNISMTVAKQGKLETHLDRKIAFGCKKQNVEPSAIFSTCLGYNLRNDEKFFSYHSYPVSDFDGIQETMVDWTKIKPDYILVVKDSDKLEDELINLVKKYKMQTGLPVVIYDEYEIKRNLGEQNIDKEQIER